jgi:hypothetical protein
VIERLLFLPFVFLLFTAHGEDGRIGRSGLSSPFASVRAADAYIIETVATCWPFIPPTVIAAVNYKMIPDWFLDIHTYRNGMLYSTSADAMGHGTNTLIVNRGEIVESVFIIERKEIKRVRVIC